MARQVDPIPKGMRAVTPNLTINGCAKAIEFYKRALGAKELSRMGAPDGVSVWHAELEIGDTVLFMSDEILGSNFKAPSRARPSPARMYVYVRDCDAAFKRAVDAGATAMMQPEDMFYGDRNAAVVDPFGYSWTFATRIKDMTAEEMRLAGEEFAKKMSAGR